MPDCSLMPSFAGLPMRSLDALGGVRAALIGVDAASPYTPGTPSHAAGAAGALRAASARFVPQLRQLDFDLGRPLLGADDDAADLADCGDLPTDPADPDGNRARITDAVRRILDAGAAPVVLGGDDSVPIPVFAAYRKPLTIVQVDAHVDWGDVIAGNPYGYGSPMRRASELPHVQAMVQLGIRGLGSGTPDQIEAAKAWGSRIFTMRDFRRHGLAPVLDAIPPGSDCVLSIDCDGLDPGIMPAVNSPTPGGLGFQDVVELLHGVAARGRIIGANLVEFVPRLDRDGLAALTAARLVALLLGIIRYANRPAAE